MPAPRSHTLMIPPFAKRQARINSLLLAAVALTALQTLGGGCKKQADRDNEQVDKDIRKAEFELKRNADGSNVIPIISRTASVKTATPENQSVANLLAGQVELHAADVALGELTDHELKLDRLLARVNQLTGQIQSNNLTIAGLTGRSEKGKAWSALIDKHSAAAKTGDAGVWVAGDAAPIPSLDAVDKSAADLQTQIDALKTRQAELQKQRADDLQRADQLAGQSDQAHGKASVDLFTQASNLRKTAGDLTTQLADIDDKLAELTRQQSVVVARQTQLKAALTRFGDEGQQAAASLQATQKRIDDITTISRGIVEGDSTSTTQPSAGVPSSLAAAGEQIDAALKDIAQSRDAAQAHLTNAESYFKAAATQNSGIAHRFSDLVRNPDFAQSPTRFAWQGLVDLHSESDPELNLANVSERTARLAADDAYFTNARLLAAQAAATAVKTAGLTLPKSLEPGDLDDKLKAAQSAATAAYANTEKLLDGVIGRTTGELTKNLSNSARVVKMIELYGRWAFARASGDKDVDSYLSDARQLAQKLAEESVPLPLPLPAEIAPAQTAPPVVASAVTPPTSAPAQTQPAGDTPEQADVRKIMTTFLTDISNGDSDGAKALTIPNQDTNTQIDLQTHLLSTLGKLADAAQAKYGVGGRLLVAGMQAGLKSGFTAALTTMQIEVSGDTATVSSRPNDPSPMTLKRVEGAWKIAPPSISPANDSQFQQMQKFSDGLDKLLADVNAGTYADAAAFVAAFQKVAADAGLPVPGVPGATPATEPTSAPATAPATAPAAP